MAKVQTSVFYRKAKVKRKGIHSKTKSSLLKSSKVYAKGYRGQGR